MQPSQLKVVFPGVEECIDKAAELCQINGNVPEELRYCVSELDRESEEVKQVLAFEDDDNRIFASIDRLEKLGDRALLACELAGNTIDEQVYNAVRVAHDAISSLKIRVLH